ncbi:cupin domain-containing protein [Natronobiforma cellulositropha]|uniref:cupin domain-containing protein n=1 Tax=Natronobiforma cellulositropha TaxID=1679076 RepID=UPI0021D60156|nr:cupin domain-containing protein [Natronobiforma cellulositropha]
MHHIDTDETSGFFEVVGETERSKAAVMNLEPGQAVGGPENRHPTSDQWLYVKSGRGTAVVEGESYDLRAGVLVCFEAGETHGLRNEGEKALETVSFYAPPDYHAEG